MGQDVAHGDLVLAVAAEPRPVFRDPVVPCHLPALPQFIEAGSGEGLGARVEHEHRVGGHRFARLRIGNSAAEVQDQAAVAVYREPGSGMDSLLYLLSKEVLHPLEGVRVHAGSFRRGDGMCCTRPARHSISIPTGQWSEPMTSGRIKPAFTLGCEGLVDEEVVDSPTYVPIPGLAHLVPVAVLSGFLVEQTQGVYVAVVQQLVDPGPFFLPRNPDVFSLALGLARSIALWAVLTSPQITTLLPCCTNRSTNSRKAS